MPSDTIIIDSEVFTESSTRNTTEIIILDDNKTDDDVMIQDNILFDRGNNKTNLYDQLIKENKLFVELIDKCLETENSPGMRRLVNCTLLNAYQRACKEFLKSDAFKKVLLKTVALLETDPDQKYQHIQHFHEALLLQRFRKNRAQLVTLETNLKKEHAKKRKLRRQNQKIKRHKQEIIEIYDIASDSDTEVIDIDEDQNEVVVLDDIPNVQNEEKENKKENIITDSPYKGTIEQPLLAPQKETNYFEPSCQDNSKRIQLIEARIKELNEKIQIVDEMEVTVDSKQGSPYLICERLKKEVVDLYKELCALNGERAFKKFKVRLEVTAGHPRGPTKVLEKYLNSQDEDQPQFPDFTDVLNCVIKGLRKDGLHWTHAQIYREASALFTQCGRALQKRRQKREWKDLLCRVKVERMVDEDPADSDPVLMARLEENRRVAGRKEREVLERYTALQNKPAEQADKCTTSGDIKLVEESCSEDSDDSDVDEENINVDTGSSNTNIQTLSSNTAIIENKSTGHNEINTHESKNGLHVDSTDRNIPAHSIEISNEVSLLVLNQDAPMPTDTNATIVKDTTINKYKEYEQAILNINNNLNRNETIFDNPNKNVTLNNADINKVTIEYNPSVSKEINGNEATEGSKSSNLDSCLENLQVKTEPKMEDIDVASLLESLGSNYTATVFDIEDPFLVIDISSDSSDDESCSVESDANS